MVIWIDGPMGVGKTTVSKAIKEKLNSTLIMDADEYFLDPDLCGFDALAECGGILPQTNFAFIEKFSKKIIEEDHSYSHIILTIALYESTCKIGLYDKLISSNSHILHIFLDTEDDILKSRIENDRHREKGLAFKLMDECRNFFAKTFRDSIVIDTTDKTPSKVADEIIALIPSA